MSQPSGMKTKTCPYCKRPYVRTNWMVRRGFKTADGKVLADTHVIKCYREKTGVMR